MKQGVSAVPDFRNGGLQEDPDLCLRSMEAASANLETTKRAYPDPEMIAQEECITIITA
ncbi:hypothetical protein SAMN05444272_4306 [Roseibium suaedae]|uniref:Uncharacterized protein n=1 Tax=Roseibium suaedae TaxID=735517 RepID=A0A1M7PCX5_9HYPH|nr:hypothetical protein SAMN05444272_4306 [Roseibium suaedae]